MIRRHVVTTVTNWAPVAVCAAICVATSVVYDHVDTRAIDAALPAIALLSLVALFVFAALHTRPTSRRGWR